MHWFWHDVYSWFSLLRGTGLTYLGMFIGYTGYSLFKLFKSRRK